MTIASLALVASLAATADPIGGTKAAPLAVPLDGSAKGFQATRTTRWLRFKSSDCRWITLSGEFSRGDSNTVVLEHVKNELPVGAGGNDDFGPVIFETNNDTLDVGISVRKYTDVALTWTSAPCVTPKPTPSTKALADALTGWTSVPTAAQLTEKLAGAGFVAGDGDWWTAAIDGVTVNVSVEKKPLVVTVTADEDYDRGAAVLESLIGAVGHATLVYRSGVERDWSATGTLMTAYLELREVGYDADPSQLTITYTKGGAR